MFRYPGMEVLDFGRDSFARSASYRDLVSFDRRDPANTKHARALHPVECSLLLMSLKSPGSRSAEAVSISVQAKWGLSELVDYDMYFRKQADDWTIPE